MIRFVDLKTGNTFDGVSPYVFWLDNAQSINLIYSQPICFISNLPRIDVKIEENDVFKLADIGELISSDTESIYEFDYHDINSIKKSFVHSDGVYYHNYYVHMIYILAYAKTPGEYIAKFTLNEEECQIGGDFYGENESLYINLSNYGVEIPEVVQKALYNINVHEENIDYITLNRKWKELLSNYWDVIANKGSYKSLYNSLQWFEYGNKVKLYEMWKDTETGRFFAQDVKKLLAENYDQTLNGFAKTTYIALCHALEKPVMNDGKMVIDREGNPVLEYVSSKWSTQDLALKLCLLGNFYSTYFMPIHLDLIHSTIEDVVYTNTIKIVRGTTMDRSDFVFNFEDVKCSVKNGDIFRLGPINSYVGPDTLFGLSYEEFKNAGVMIGVQTGEVNELTTNEDWAAYASQMYSNIGAVAEFELEVPLTGEDKIKKEQLIYKTYVKNDEGKYVSQTKSVIRHKLLDKHIKFQLFCPIEGDYDVRLQFDTLDGKTYVKRVFFKVIDTSHVALNVYKIYNVQMLDNYTLGETSTINNYGFVRTGKNKEPNLADILNNGYSQYVQYLPAKTNNLALGQFKWKGVCLNHLIILNGNFEEMCRKNEIFTEGDLNIINRYYYITCRYVDAQGAVGTYKKCYTILVSRTFGFHYNQSKNTKYTFDTIIKQNNMIYRDDYIFVPEFHKLVPIDNERNGRIEDIKYYEITDNDALCVIPELAYSKDIAECDWEFVNDSRPFDSPIKLSHIKEPFITTGTRSPLTPGYYTVKFHYRLTNENKINTIELNSAFKKV